jgi:hypothetical protein
MIVFEKIIFHSPPRSGSLILARRFNAVTIDPCSFVAWRRLNLGQFNRHYVTRLACAGLPRVKRRAKFHLPLRGGLEDYFFQDHQLVIQTVPHSQRSAISGSTFVARRAGIQHAISVTSANPAAITVYVSGSAGRTPNNIVSIHLVITKAAV